MGVLGARMIRRYRALAGFLLLTAATTLALYLAAHNQQVQNRRAQAAARAGLVQAKQSCLRAQLGVPTLVKVMRILERAQDRVPDIIPPELRITVREIQFYEDLRPARC